MNKINLFVASGSELKEEHKETILVIHELRKENNSVCASS